MTCRQYLSESFYLKHICTLPDNLEIHICDKKAFYDNNELQYLYDKLFIAKSQGLHKNMTEYVVIRPRVNLLGMGFDAKVVHKSKVVVGDFWVEYLMGPHISVDIFINTNYGIQYIIAFSGEKSKNFGSFNYWCYLPNYRLKPHIRNWIIKYVKNYNGIINIEIIGDYIIECHLRMGDLDKFQDCKIIQGVIDCYMNKKIAITVKNKKFYILPIFEKEYRILPNPQKHKNLLCYEIDKENMSHPVGERRLGVLYVNDLEVGLKLRNKWKQKYI